MIGKIARSTLPIDNHVVFTHAGQFGSDLGVGEPRLWERPCGPRTGVEVMGERLGERCLPVVACGTNVKGQAGHEDEWRNSTPFSSHEGAEMTLDKTGSGSAI